MNNTRPIIHNYKPVSKTLLKHFRHELKPKVAQNDKKLSDSRNKAVTTKPQ